MTGPLKSPLAEGRELKSDSDGNTRARFVAPRGGA